METDALLCVKNSHYRPKITSDAIPAIDSNVYEYLSEKAPQRSAYRARTGGLPATATTLPMPMAVKALPITPQPCLISRNMDRKAPIWRSKRLLGLTRLQHLVCIMDLAFEKAVFFTAIECSVEVKVFRSSHTSE